MFTWFGKKKSADGATNPSQLPSPINSSTTPASAPPPQQQQQQQSNANPSVPTIKTPPSAAPGPTLNATSATSSASGPMKKSLFAGMKIASSHAQLAQEQTSTSSPSIPSTEPVHSESPSNHYSSVTSSPVSSNNEHAHNNPEGVDEAAPAVKTISRRRGAGQKRVGYGNDNSTASSATTPAPQQDSSPPKHLGKPVPSASTPVIVTTNANTGEVINPPVVGRHRSNSNSSESSGVSTDNLRSQRSSREFIRTITNNSTATQQQNADILDFTGMVIHSKPKVSEASASKPTTNSVPTQQQQLLQRKTEEMLQPVQKNSLVKHVEEEEDEEDEDEEEEDEEEDDEEEEEEDNANEEEQSEAYLINMEWRRMQTEMNQEFHKISTTCHSVSSKKKDFVSKKRSLEEKIQRLTQEIEFYKKQVKIATDSDEFDKATDYENKITDSEAKMEDIKKKLSQVVQQLEDIETDRMKIPSQFMSLQNSFVSKLEKLFETFHHTVQNYSKDVSVKISYAEERLKSEAERIQREQVNVKLDMEQLEKRRQRLNEKIDEQTVVSRKQRDDMAVRISDLELEINDLKRQLTLKENEAAILKKDMQKIDKQINKAKSKFEKEIRELNLEEDSYQRKLKQFKEEQEKFLETKRRIENEKQEFSKDYSEKKQQLKELKQNIRDSKKSISYLQLQEKISKFNLDLSKIKKSQPKKDLEEIRILQSQHQNTVLEIEEIERIIADIRMSNTILLQQLQDSTEKLMPKLLKDKQMAIQAKQYKEAGEVTKQISSLKEKQTIWQDQLEKQQSQLERKQEELEGKREEENLLAEKIQKAVAAQYMTDLKSTLKELFELQRLLIAVQTRLKKEFERSQHSPVLQTIATIVELHKDNAQVSVDELVKKMKLKNDDFMQIQETVQNELKYSSGISIEEEDSERSESDSEEEEVDEEESLHEEVEEEDRKLQPSSLIEDSTAIVIEHQEDANSQQYASNEENAVSEIQQNQIKKEIDPLAGINIQALRQEFQIISRECDNIMYKINEAVESDSFELADELQQQYDTLERKKLELHVTIEKYLELLDSSAAAEQPHQEPQVVETEAAREDAPSASSFEFIGESTNQSDNIQKEEEQQESAQEEPITSAFSFIAPDSNSNNEENEQQEASSSFDFVNNEEEKQQEAYGGHMDDTHTSGFGFINSSEQNEEQDQIEEEPQSAFGFLNQESSSHEEQSKAEDKEKTEESNANNGDASAFTFLDESSTTETVQEEEKLEEQPSNSAFAFI